VQALQTDVSGVQASLTLKADQTAVDAVQTDVSGVQASLTLKADQTGVDAVQTDVSALQTAETELKNIVGYDQSWPELRNGTEPAGNLLTTLKGATNAIGWFDIPQALKDTYSATDNIYTKVLAADTGVQALQTDVSGVQASLTLKADQTAVDAVQTDVSGVQASLTLKADQTGVDALQDIVFLTAEFGRVPITPSSLVSATPALLSTTGAELLFEHPNTPYYNNGSNYNAYSTWEAGAGAEVIVDAGKVYNVTEVSFYKAFMTADRTPRLYQIFSGESASGPWIEQGSATFTGTLTQNTEIKADGMNFNTRYIRYLMSGMDDPLKLYMHEIVTRGVNRLASGTELNLQTLKADNTIQLPAIEYPPSPMTQNTQALTGGTYAASASASLSASFLAFKAFDAIIASVWHSTDQYDATTGVYKSSAATTSVDAVDVRGEWLQLVMPTAVAISSVTIRAQPTATDAARRSPRDFIVAALIDGAWTQVMQRVGVNDWTESEQKTFEFDAIRTAASYRIITQRVGNSANGIFQNVCTIAEVRFIEQPVTTLTAELAGLQTDVSGVQASLTLKADQTAVDAVQTDVSGLQTAETELKNIVGYDQSWPELRNGTEPAGNLLTTVKGATNAIGWFDIPQALKDTYSATDNIYSKLVALEARVAALENPV
jgi:predicted phage tail protein